MAAAGNAELRRSCTRRVHPLTLLLPLWIVGPFDEVPMFEGSMHVITGFEWLVKQTTDNHPFSCKYIICYIPRTQIKQERYAIKINPFSIFAYF